MTDFKIGAKIATLAQVEYVRKGRKQAIAEMEDDIGEPIDSKELNTGSVACLKYIVFKMTKELDCLNKKLQQYERTENE